MHLLDNLIFRTGRTQCLAARCDSVELHRRRLARRAESEEQQTRLGALEQGTIPATVPAPQQAPTGATAPARATSHGASTTSSSNPAQAYLERLDASTAALTSWHPALHPTLHAAPSVGASSSQGDTYGNDSRPTSTTNASDGEAVLAATFNCQPSTEPGGVTCAPPSSSSGTDAGLPEPGRGNEGTWSGRAHSWDTPRSRTAAADGAASCHSDNRRQATAARAEADARASVPHPHAVPWLASEGQGGGTRGRTGPGHEGMRRGTSLPTPVDCPELHDLSAMFAGMTPAGNSEVLDSDVESRRLELLERPDSLIIARNRWAKAGLEAKAQGRRPRASSAVLGSSHVNGSASAGRSGRRSGGSGHEGSMSLDMLRWRAVSPVALLRGGEPDTPSARYTVQRGDSSGRERHPGAGGRGADASPAMQRASRRANATSPGSSSLHARSGSPSHQAAGSSGRAAVTSTGLQVGVTASQPTRPGVLDRLKALLLSAPAHHSPRSRTPRQRSSAPQGGSNGMDSGRPVRLASAPAGQAAPVLN